MIGREPIVDNSAALLGRRTLFKAGLATVGVGAAGCVQQSGTNSGLVPPSERVPLPTHVPFATSPPDLRGEGGSTDGFLRYPTAPPKTVTDTPGDGKPVTALASIFTPAPPAMSQNRAWQRLNNELGSEFQFEYVTAADYKARFATAVAGNDLPAMMELADVPNKPQFLRARFVDLTEHLSGDAVKKYPNLANLPPAAWQAGVFNNAIYGIPTDRGMWQTSILLQRSDLVAQRGLDAGTITNFDDLYRLCGQLTDAKSSRWALTTVPIAYVRQMLGVPNTWRRNDNGTLTSAFEVEEQEEALNACIKLWRAGVVHPDAFSLSGVEAKQQFGAGRTYLIPDTYPAWFQFYREQANFDGFDIDGMPLPGYYGGEARVHLGAPAYSVAAISQGHADRVETILKVWNYLAAPFGSAEHLTVIYGQEGDDYTLQGSDPIQTERGKREALSLVTLVCAPRVAYYPADSRATQKFYDHMKKMAQNALPNPAIYRYSPTESTKSFAINRQITGDFNDIILGRKKINDWKQSVATWRTSGGDAIRTELEEALAAE